MKQTILSTPLPFSKICVSFLTKSHPFGTGTMFVISEISVHESVAETKFACNLEACKGACCTFPGGRGAPLMDSEVDEIEKAYPIIEWIIPDKHRKEILRSGLVDGTRGNFATQCVDGKACVFVYYENEIAKCSFEKAFLEKKIEWRKPMSCHLFPIRVDREGNGIHYEYFGECDPALKRGIEEDIPLHRFAEVPLERKYGKEFTERLNKQIENQ